MAFVSCAVGGVDVDAKRDMADGVVERGASLQVFGHDLVSAVDAPAFAGADLLRGGHEAQVSPRSAAGPQSIHDPVDFAAGFQRGRRDARCIRRQGVVLVVGHHGVETVADAEDRGILIGRVHSGAAHLGQQVGLGLAKLALLRLAPDELRDGVQRRAGQQRHEAHGLRGAVIGTPQIELAAGQSTRSPSPVQSMNTRPVQASRPDLDSVTTAASRFAGSRTAPTTRVWS